jgi:heme/copper-type cytochrome/quinol oxidase subunit 1
LVCSLLSALLLRLSALTPNGILAKDAYDLVFSVHGRLTLPVSNTLTLLLLSLESPIDARDGWRRRTFAVALGLTILEPLVVTVLPIFGLPAELEGGASSLTVGAMSVCLVWGAAQSLPISSLDTLVLLGAALSLWFGWVRQEYLLLLCLACLSSRWVVGKTTGAFPDRRFSGKRELFLLLSVPLAFHSLLGVSLLFSTLWVFCSVWFATLVWKRMTPPVPLATRWLARAGLALLVLFAASATMLRMVSPESHLYDTLFAVACNHAAFLGAALMAFAAALRELPVASVNGRAFRIGVGLCLAGSAGFLVAFCVLGSRGMPRRYIAYLPEFIGLHRVASASTVVLFAGALSVLLALLQAWRVSPPRPSAGASLRE